MAFTAISPVRFKDAFLPGVLPRAGLTRLVVPARLVHLCRSSVIVRAQTFSDRYPEAGHSFPARPCGETVCHKKCEARRECCFFAARNILLNGTLSRKGEARP